jgi:hypothetical protein
MLSNPVHAVRILVCGLHFLLLVDVGSLCVRHLLSQHFTASLTVRTVGRLHDAEVWKALDRRLLLNDVRLLSVGVRIVGWLRLGYDARLLVDDGRDLEMECQQFVRMEYLLAERRKCLGLKTCSLVDVGGEVDRILVFKRKLYSRQRDSCRLHSNWNCADLDCSRCDGASNCLRNVCYTSNHDGAIGARNIGVEMWTIGRVSSLRLEILLWWSDHDEVAPGFAKMVGRMKIDSCVGRTC